MYKYRNVKTGAVIDVPSKVSGKNWEMIGGGKVEQTPTAIPGVPLEQTEVKPVKKTRKTAKKTTK